MRYRNIIATGLGIFMTALSTGLFFGCTNTIDGTKTENQPPILWFVNIPPENESFSKNPIINWVGQDNDGQVVTYRYAVLREDEIQAVFNQAPPYTQSDIQTFIQTVLLSMDDTVWTYLDVEQEAGEPKTSNIVPLKAELADPVNTIVPQYVFVQAFDDQGAVSEVIFRRFLRNDNPPQTFIRRFDPSDTKINSVASLSAATGIRISWEGQDRIDFPTEPPPFEFEWRLYGPYTDSVFSRIEQNFIKQVFVTNDARIFEFYDSLFFPVCHQELDSLGNLIEVCDTVFIDTIQGANALGVVDTLFDFQDSAFANDTSLNKIAAESFDGVDSWVSNTSDSIFNVFVKEPTDSTITRKFVFMVRSRDDAQVPDLTPAFASFNVVDPHFERNLLVVDMNKIFRLNARRTDTARQYWQRAVDAWQAKTGLPVDYVDSLDYLDVNTPQGSILPLEKLLGHKVAILINDDVLAGSLSVLLKRVVKGITSGVNTWLAARAPIVGNEATSPIFGVALPPEYQTFFGVKGLVFSGWDWWVRQAHNDDPDLVNVRMEDFIGAHSLDVNRWPNLSIDTANLHWRYVWGDTTHISAHNWMDTIAALPEVDWFVRIPPTEPMYLYQSRFGPRHFLGELYSFEGRPVMIRYNAGLFRTAHSLFAPYAFNDDESQQLLESMLEWLFNGRIAPPGATSAAAMISPGSDGAPDPAYSKRLLDQYWEAKNRELEMIEPFTYDVKHIRR